MFAGSMQLLAGVKLCTGRALTNHPHYEDSGLRERTRAVSGGGAGAGQALGGRLPGTGSSRGLGAAQAIHARSGEPRGADREAPEQSVCPQRPRSC